MDHIENAILVAIGRHGSDAAIEFAISEARRTQSAVHLVQVAPMTSPVEDTGTYPAAAATAEAELEQALAHARKRGADTGTDVSGERVDSRKTVDGLVRLADRGRMIVLQQRRIGGLHRILTGSTINGVASRADVPAVAVPEDWSATDDEAPVTVAVQDTGEAHPLLRAGFEQARSRGTSLNVLHAWWVAGTYELALVDEDVRRNWTTRTRAELEPVIEEFAAEFPGVKVDLEIRHGVPIDALMEASRRSSLLILGRRHHLLPLGSHLGPVARTTLHHSTCPVFMVPAAT